MKYDVLSLGPFRMDCFVTLPEDEVVEVCSMDRRRCMIELGFGEKIPVSSMKFSIGGNAANNAVGMSRLGLTAAIVGTIGDGWTEKQAMEILKSEGVETKFTENRAGQQAFGVIINYQGERTILSYYSHTDCNWPADETLDASWIYLTSMGDGYEDFYQRYFGLDVIVIRTSWVYGPGLPRNRAPKSMIENSLKGMETNMENGADHRVDHTYIDDFLQGALLAFEVVKPKSRVFNIASGKAHTFREMGEMVGVIIPGAKITIGPGLMKYSQEASAPQKGALNIERAKSELGYVPRYDLFEGLKKYTEYLKKG